MGGGGGGLGLQSGDRSRRGNSKCKNNHHHTTTSIAMKREDRRNEVIDADTLKCHENKNHTTSIQGQGDPRRTCASAGCRSFASFGWALRLRPRPPMRRRSACTIRKPWYITIRAPFWAGYFIRETRNKKRKGTGLPLALTLNPKP